MGSLKDSLLAALPYMPEHRKLRSRTRRLTLDTLLDEGRHLSPLPAGALDFILMGYRYHEAFREFLGEFSKKALKPRTLEDLLEVLFAALLTRDQTPAHALVMEGVEAARQAFGEHVTGLTNAFLRKCLREKDLIQKKIRVSPEALLGPKMVARWKPRPDLLGRMASQLQLRPEGGVWSFDAKGEFKARDISEFKAATEPLQAMDLGSWLYLEWLTARVLEKFPAPRAPLRILDACAAPGGKSLGLITQLKNAGVTCESYATDGDFKRLERLKVNLGRWKLGNEVKTALVTWGTGYKTQPVPEWGDFDVILADVPCSGSGTLHTRPDLLLEDLPARIAELSPLQIDILAGLSSRLRPHGLVAVSICSVDPPEIDALSKALGLAPAFSSFDATDKSVEGLLGWVKSAPISVTI